MDKEYPNVVVAHLSDETDFVTVHLLKEPELEQIAKRHPHVRVWILYNTEANSIQAYFTTARYKPWLASYFDTAGEARIKTLYKPRSPYTYVGLIVTKNHRYSSEIDCPCNKCLKLPGNPTRFSMIDFTVDEE